MNPLADDSFMVCPSALPAGSAPGSVGAAPETNPAVLPHCCLRVHGTVAGVRLQTPLERRADRTPAGGADGSAGGESSANLFIASERLSFLSSLRIALRLLQVFFVSDLFKKPPDSREEAEIPHSTLQETPTSGNHFESPN